jgi:uncharacterized membrane protein YczE
VRPSALVPDRLVERLARCVAGLALFGLGIACFVRSELGLGPWDVFHQGVAEQLDVSIGTVVVGTGLALLPVFIALGVRLGIGTVLNTIEIGLTLDLWLHAVPETDAVAARVAYLAAGLAVIGVGSGLYIGAGLGPGPRDGIMVGLARRGLSIRVARTLIELSALTVGVLLGGSVGIGTALFALGIGPIVQWCMPRLAIRESHAARAVTTRHGLTREGRAQ